MLSLMRIRIALSSERITLYVDRESHLPRRIVSKSHVDPLGDVTLASTFDAFIDAESSACAGLSGVKVPARITSLVDEAVVSDLKHAPPRMHPFAANLLDNIRNRGLRVDRIMPIHGYIVPFADLVAAARTTPLNTR
jgi:hypothetical protein